MSAAFHEARRHNRLDTFQRTVSAVMIEKTLKQNPHLRVSLITARDNTEPVKRVSGYSLDGGYKCSCTVASMEIEASE